MCPVNDMQALRSLAKHDFSLAPMLASESLRRRLFELVHLFIAQQQQSAISDPAGASHHHGKTLSTSVSLTGLAGATGVQVNVTTVRQALELLTTMADVQAKGFLLVTFVLPHAVIAISGGPTVIM